MFNVQCFIVFVKQHRQVTYSNDTVNKILMKEFDLYIVREEVKAECGIPQTTLYYHHAAAMRDDKCLHSSSMHAGLSLHPMMLTSQPPSQPTIQHKSFPPSSTRASSMQTTTATTISRIFALEVGSSREERGVGFLLPLQRERGKGGLEYGNEEISLHVADSFSLAAARKCATRSISRMRCMLTTPRVTYNAKSTKQHHTHTKTAKNRFGQLARNNAPFSLQLFII